MGVGGLGLLDQRVLLALHGRLDLVAEGLLVANQTVESLSKCADRVQGQGRVGLRRHGGSDW